MEHKDRRISKLFEDVFSDPDDGVVTVWPWDEYARCEKACSGDSDALLKLRRLHDDLESVLSANAGPGSFARISLLPREQLKVLHGRCWREILLDEKLDSSIWAGIRLYSIALKSSQMDEYTRRAGAIFHAVAVARLERLGFVEKNAQARKLIIAEREAIRSKAYVPDSLRKVLS
jgi:hypothetical protein